MTANPSPPKTETEIPHPRRLLLLTPTSHSSEIIPPFLHSLTGVLPSERPNPTDADADAGGSGGGSFAGYTTHPPLHLKNRYYIADIPIWVDEIPIPISIPRRHSVQDGETRTRTGIGPAQDTNPPTPTVTATATAAETWKTEFSSPEARVVRDALGGIVICLPNPNSNSSSVQSTYPPGVGGNGCGEDYANRRDVRGLMDFVRNVAAVVSLIEEERDLEPGVGGRGDVLGLVVLAGHHPAPAPASAASMSMPTADELDISAETEAEPEEEPFSPAWWEDRFFDSGITGLEVVSWDPDPKREDSGKNRFGELQGMRRIKEVLETHDWAGPGPDGDEELEKELLGMDSEDGFNIEVDELEREMVGLRMAIERGGDESAAEEETDVDNMEALMSRVHAIKDMSAEMPEHERKRFAAKAVSDIMKEI